MEVIRINRERIKIMLSTEDMKELNINTELFDKFEYEGREAFARILKEARDKCGFISCGRKILVQIFNSIDGGCEMFITKIPDRDDAFTIKNKSMFYYKFERLNDIISLSKAITSIDDGICNIYKESDSTVIYLETSEKIHICGEYGGRKCKSSAKAYISEHCELVFGKAFEKLREY